MSQSKSFQENIIVPSLELIKNDGKVKRLYFLPGTLSLIFLSILLTYQSIYTYIVILWKQEAAFEIILNFLHSQYLTSVIISAVVFIIFYLAIVPIFDGGLIRYIDQKISGKPTGVSDSIGFWVFRFYPMFEYNNIFSMFKLVSLVNALLFSIRFLWIEYLSYMITAFFIAFVFSIVINTLIAYTRYEIVLENKTVFQAIGTSAKISLLSLKTTIKLYLMMFVVNIRVVFNFLLFLVFPLVCIWVVGIATSSVFQIIAIIILGLIFLLLVISIAYMTTVLEVFTTAIWYFAYKEWKQKLDAAKTE
jgi:hypothetical protein